tara:strand:+ start:56 stop:1033 length:978 start_codon:yes stop_codon:yes gene_type:complete
MLPRRPIRIATLGDWGRYFSYFLAGTQEGTILNGCLFRPIDIRIDPSMIRNCIKEFRPDIMFCHCIFNNDIPREKIFEILADTRKGIGTKIFYHMGDYRTEPRYPHNIQHIIDGGLVNHHGPTLNKFSKIWCIPTYYWPYGCFYQKEIAGVNEEFAHPLVFTGRLKLGGVHNQRTIFIDQIKKKRLKIKIYPNEKYPDTKLLTPEIAASSEAVLGVCTGYDRYGYIDVRPFQYPGAGAFLLQRYYKGMEKVFKQREHMVWFDNDNPDNFVEIYNEWINHSEYTKVVRQQGFTFCQKHHSMKRRVEDVIKIVYEGATKTNFLLEDL